MKSLQISNSLSSANISISIQFPEKIIIQSIEMNSNSEFVPKNNESIKSKVIEIKAKNISNVNDEEYMISNGIATVDLIFDLQNTTTANNDTSLYCAYIRTINAIDVDSGKTNWTIIEKATLDGNKAKCFKIDHFTYFAIIEKLSSELNYKHVDTSDSIKYYILGFSIAGCLLALIGAVFC